MLKTRIYLGGTFDCLHTGHIELFRRAKEAGYVIVSLNTDEFTTKYKRRPVMSLVDRMSVIKALRYVDEVVVNEGGADSTIAILKTKPNEIWHGDDWTGDALMKQMGLTQEFLDKHQIKMVYTPYYQGTSTTKIIKNFTS